MCNIKKILQHLYFYIIKVNIITLAEAKIKFLLTFTHLLYYQSQFKYIQLTNLIVGTMYLNLPAQKNLPIIPNEKSTLDIFFLCLIYLPPWSMGTQGWHRGYGQKGGKSSQHCPCHALCCCYVWNCCNYKNEKKIR